MKTNKELWDGLEEVFKNKDHIDCGPYPIKDISIFGITILIWKQSQGFTVELLETEPYEKNGTYPLIFAKLWYIEVMFCNKLLYKFINWIKE